MISPLLLGPRAQSLPHAPAISFPLRNEEFLWAQVVFISAYCFSHRLNSFLSTFIRITCSIVHISVVYRVDCMSPTTTDPALYSQMLDQVPNPQTHNELWDWKPVFRVLTVYISSLSDSPWIFDFFPYFKHFWSLGTTYLYMFLAMYLPSGPLMTLHSIHMVFLYVHVGSYV